MSPTGASCAINMLGNSTAAAWLFAIAMATSSGVFATFCTIKASSRNHLVPQSAIGAGSPWMRRRGAAVLLAQPLSQSWQPLGARPGVFGTQGIQRVDDAPRRTHRFLARDIRAHAAVRGNGSRAVRLRADVALERGNQDVEHIPDPPELAADTGYLAEDPAFQDRAG